MNAPAVRYDDGRTFAVLIITTGMVAVFAPVIDNAEYKGLTRPCAIIAYQ